MTDVQEQAGQAPEEHQNRPSYQKWQPWAAMIIALVAAAAGIASALAWTSTPAPKSTSTQESSTTAPATTAVASPLVQALSAEREAKATYDNVIASFGTVQPFSAVSSAERQHIAIVTGLARRHSVSLPSGPFNGLPAPTTITEACQMGVTTEQNIVSMYTLLLPQVTDFPDVAQAFSNLQAAARHNHLPAFERCAAAAETTPGTTTTTTATTATAATTAQASAGLATALKTAATAEQDTKATYDNVIATFGTVQPFATVSSAEAQHIAAVQALAQRYGVSLPSGPFNGLPAPATITEACQMGVTAEQNIVSMYTLLLPQVTGYADVTTGFSNLQAAARDNHLPAFEQCA